MSMEVKEVQSVSKARGPSALTSPHVIIANQTGDIPTPRVRRNTVTKREFRRR